MDAPTVAASVVKTGRLTVAHEAPTFRRRAGELAAAITERCFYSLQAPVCCAWAATICRTRYRSTEEEYVRILPYPEAVDYP